MQNCQTSRLNCFLFLMNNSHHCVHVGGKKITTLQLKYKLMIVQQFVGFFPSSHFCTWFSVVNKQIKNIINIVDTMYIFCVTKQNKTTKKSTEKKHSMLTVSQNKNRKRNKLNKQAINQIM